MSNRFTVPEDMEEVTIYQRGSEQLIGRTMHTDKGPKVIARIHPHRYKAVNIYFDDGTGQLRDYNEPFRIYKDRRDDPETLDFTGYTYDENKNGTYDLYYNGAKVMELKYPLDLVLRFISDLNGRLKPATHRHV